MKKFVESVNERIKVLQAEIDRSRQKQERRESRLFVDIARQKLSALPQDFIQYAWGRIRKEYSSRLEKRVGPWGEMDITMFIAAISDTYSLNQIFDVFFESVGPDILDAPEQLPPEQPASMPPGKLIPFPRQQDQAAIEKLAANYDRKMVDEQVAEMRDYLNLQKGKDNDTS